MISNSTTSVSRAGGPGLTLFFVFCGVSVASNLYVLLPLTGALAGAFGVSRSLASFASGGFLVAYALGFLLIGPAMDRFSRRTALLGSLLALSLATFAVSVSGTFTFLLIMRFTQGLAASAIAPTILASVMEFYPERKRPGVLALVTAGFLAAGIIGQILGTGLAGRWGWQGSFVVLGLVHLLTIGALPLLPSSRGEYPRAASLILVPRDLLADRELRRAYLAALTLMTAFVGMYATLGARFGSSAASAGLLFRLRALGILGVLPSLFAGRLARRFGGRGILAASLFLALIGLIAETLTGTGYLALIGVWSVVFVAGISTSMPVLIGMIGERAGAARGRAVAFFMFLLFFGASLAPILAGRADYRAVNYLLAALLAFGLLAVLNMRGARRMAA